MKGSVFNILKNTPSSGRVGALQRLREVGRAADESLGAALLRAATELLQPLRLLGRQPLVLALPQLPLARLCVRMT